VGLGNDSELSFGIDHADVYTAMKEAAEKFAWSERLMHSNPDIPMSPPGGTEWAQAGLKDGRELRTNWTNAFDAKARPRTYPHQGQGPPPSPEMRMP